LFAGFDARIHGSVVAQPIFKMHVDSLRVFCDLVDTASFSKAATMHGITQSAVSQQVRALETRFGCTLLERSRRGVAATPEGNAFYATCREMLASWTAFENRVGELKHEIAGELRIASIFSIGLHDLPARLVAFRAGFPHVAVHVDYRRSAQVYEMVESGEAHIGLVAFPVKRPGIMFDIFDEDKLVVICHPKHALAGKKRITLTAVAGEPFIGFEPDTPTRKMTDRYLRKAGVKVTPVNEFDNIETVKRAVEIGSGISIVPARTVATEVASGQLAAIDVESPRMTRPLATIVSRNRPRPPGMKEFIALLKDGGAK
jgi:DNA-binding transcriptional LysR family regulator